MQQTKSIEIGPLIKIISHDLRGPLGNLKSVVSLFRSGELPMEQAREFMNHIEEGVDKSIEMLDGLLEWGQASSADKDLVSKEINVNELILEVHKNMTTAFQLKNIDFTFKDESDFIAVYDKNSFKVILRNLLSNSVKFTPRGGSVSVNVEEFGDDLIISVIDTGIGISAHARESIFEMNKDNRRPGTENEKGAGLGLFMCQDLITKNGSRIWLEDNLEGQGTIFSFTVRK